jgi:transposase InsO family protein
LNRLAFDAASFCEKDGDYVQALPGRATVGTPEGMYGRRKMTAYLRRWGYRVAGCTVDRLDRDFTAAAPNRKWVTDFACMRTWSGFAYVAFVVDCYSRAIVGWHAATRWRCGAAITPSAL